MDSATNRHESSPRPLMPARWRRQRLNRLVIVTGVVFLLFGVGVVVAILGTPLGRIMVYLAFNKNPGPFDRRHFETVVAQVRKPNLKPGEVHELRLDDPSDPTSLRPFRDAEIGAGKGNGNVWAELSWTGRLKVVIQTRDLGHAGSYGFAYSKEPLRQTPFGFGDGDWQELDVPGHLNMVLPEMQIDEHWWRVEFNLV